MQVYVFNSIRFTFVFVNDMFRSPFVSYILIALAWENRLQALQKLVRLIFSLAFQTIPLPWFVLGPFLRGRVSHTLV